MTELRIVKGTRGGIPWCIKGSGGIILLADNIEAAPDGYCFFLYCSDVWFGTVHSDRIVSWEE